MDLTPICATSHDHTLAFPVIHQIRENYKYSFALYGAHHCGVYWWVSMMLEDWLFIYFIFTWLTTLPLVFIMYILSEKPITNQCSLHIGAHHFPDKIVAKSLYRLGCIVLSWSWTGQQIYGWWSLHSDLFSIQPLVLKQLALCCGGLWW